MAKIAATILKRGDGWRVADVLCHAGPDDRPPHLQTTSLWMPDRHRPPAVARVTKGVRAIDRKGDATLSLHDLAKRAGLSSYHFLRTFTRLTGTTPHQFALRASLRAAALRLTLTRERIIDVALDSGFGDVSNFNRTFRAEFGVSPRQWRNYSAGTLRSYVPTGWRSSPSTPKMRN